MQKGKARAKRVGVSLPLNLGWEWIPSAGITHTSTTTPGKFGLETGRGVNERLFDVLRDSTLSLYLR